MHIVNTVGHLRKIIAEAKQRKKCIGFVPTMGAFHEGHLSLMRRSKKENDITVVSIFVNPKQFGPNEDFKNYPREKKKDIFLAKKENVDIIFLPSEKTIYPDRFLTYITVEHLSSALCGVSRPGHFRGVTTVVGKLLNIVEPDVLYLGQKDAQQCVVIQQMVRDLNFPTQVKILQTVREKDGLAYSSRNQYLNTQQRKEATVLYQSLKLAKQKITAGERNSFIIKTIIRHNIQKNSSGKIDYIECIDAKTLRPLKQIQGETLIALAVYFDRTRLIDNVIVQKF